jgi:sec-independent protein translocase protein TatA
MLAFLGSLGPWEIVLIVVIALLVFGAKKLPELGRSVGKGIKEFKKGMNDIENDIYEDVENKKDPYKEINQKLKNEEEKNKNNQKQTGNS